MVMVACGLGHDNTLQAYIKQFKSLKRNLVLSALKMAEMSEVSNTPRLV
jgi:hypothetical protein